MTEERTVLDQRVDAARRAEGLARHRRQVMELKQGLILHERIARELAFKLLAESEIADPPHAMNDDDLVDALVDNGIAREAEEWREPGAGHEHEQPPAGGHRAAADRAGRLAAERERTGIGGA